MPFGGWPVVPANVPSDCRVTFASSQVGAPVSYETNEFHE